LEKKNRVNLKPLKEAISAHIDRLKQAPYTEAVGEALRSLEQSRDLISSGCGHSSMVIDF